MVRGARKEAEETAWLLREALQALPDAVTVFDAEDRLVFWNGHYEQMYPRRAPLRRGIRFETLLREALAEGSIAEAVGREEAWIEQRMHRHRNPAGSHESRLATGRWIRVQEYRSPDGWSISIRSDISDLKEKEESFRLLFEANPTPMYVMDFATLRLASVNDAALALYGYDRARFVTMTALDLRPERDHAEFLRFVEDGFAYSNTGSRSWTHVRADGLEMTVVPYSRPLTMDGRSMCVVCVVDMTERLKAEDEVRQTWAFLNSVVESIPLGLFVKDMGDRGRYVVYNRAGLALAGRSQEATIGRLDEDIFPAEEADRFRKQDIDVMRASRLQLFAETALLRGDGEVRATLARKLPIADQRSGEPRYIVGIVEDVTERQRMASRLTHMAHHDALTGLPNRTLLHLRLGALVSEGPRAIALHYMDLDGFKAVNDTLGHRVGDSLLCAVAARLSRVLSPSDLVARLGGDEFVVLQEGVETADAATALARLLVATVGAPYDVDGHHVVIGASVGIAIAEHALDDADALLRNADTALYAVKAEGGRACRLFAPEMDSKASLRRELAGEFMRALADEEFELFYQPFVDAGAGTLAGFEALVRWRHPLRGLIAPCDFIPVAEQIGLIGALGGWVVRQACRDAASWPIPCTVAVNLSPVQFEEPDLLETVRSALDTSGLEPGRLELEITETVLLDGSDRNLAVLEDLRALGVRIALDDFGTGFSSLSHLQRFAVDKIKIDRSFTRGLPLDRGSLAVLRAVVALARSLDIDTTAEGVETDGQFACVSAEGCGAVQGYLLGRPAPLAELAPWFVPASASVAA